MSAVASRSKSRRVKHDAVKTNVHQEPVRAKNIFNLTDDDVRERWNFLTPTEQRILKLYAFGYANRKIAEIRNISSKTLDIHRANLSRKLGSKPWGFGRYFFAAQSLGLEFSAYPE